MPGLWCLPRLFLLQYWFIVYIIGFLLREKIDFISYNNNWQLFVRGVVFNLFQPFDNIIKWIALGYIVYENCSDRATVIGSCYWFVRLLPCLHLRSCTVSQICNCIVLPWTCRVLDPNYTPIVGSESCRNCLSINCMSMHDFPTPLSNYNYFDPQRGCTWREKSSSF